MYHSLRKDAYLPGDEDVNLPDYIKEDDNLCKLLDEESPISIFPFIRYTALDITNVELYGTYSKIMDRHGEQQNMLSYDDVFMLTVNDLWSDMVSGRLNYNASGVVNKIGDDVIDMKEEILKEVYGITK
jgi:hypothetical protein